MFEGSSKKIANALLRENIICSTDLEIYEYGIRQIFTILLNVLSTLIIGVAFRMFWESALFLIAYMALRRYAGGFHSQTSFRCYMYSNVVIIAVLLVLKNLSYHLFTYNFLAVIGGILIFSLAPVEDFNKPLDATEQCVYRKKAYFILLVELCTYLLLISFRLNKIAAVISMVLFVLGLIVLIGKLKNCYISYVSTRKRRA